MKKPAKSIFSVIIPVMLTMTAMGFVSSTSAEAGQFALFGSKIELAYAPQDNLTDDRFDQFENEEELHELNDAWLGMPAYSSEGKMVGHVEDAYIDQDGNVTRLLVSLSGKKIAVYVGGKNVQLTETKVAISLPAKTIAGLEREAGFEVSSR